jgi:hypothetical protein
MKSLLDKVRQLDRKTDEARVKEIIESFDDLPSVDDLEAVVAHFKAMRYKIVTGDLLEWMQENDQTTFETDQVKVTIRTHVSPKIDPDNPEPAFKWLEERDYGDLIKDTLALAKGEFTEDVRNALAELGVSYTQKSGIHPQTLKKVISDRLKDGEDLPTEGEDGFVKVEYYDECVVKEK